jgi:hypothetical protein
VFARAPDQGAGSSGGGGGVVGARKQRPGGKAGGVGGRRVSGAEPVLTSPLLLPFPLLPGTLHERVCVCVWSVVGRLAPCNLR